MRTPRPSKGEAHRLVYNVRVNLTLTEEQKNQLFELAHRERMNQSELVRSWIAREWEKADE